MDKRKLTHRFWASFRFFIGFGSTAFNLRQRVLCPSNLHGRFRFSCHHSKSSGYSAWTVISCIDFLWGADSHEYQKVNGQYDDGHLDSDIRNHEITGEKLCQVGMGKQIIFDDFIVL